MYAVSMSREANERLAEAVTRGWWTEAAYGAKPVQCSRPMGAAYIMQTNKIGRGDKWARRTLIL
jgi:hypothetical protein